MGHHTLLNCAFFLKPETPGSVIAMLQHMKDRRNPEPPRPKHKFFDCQDWHHVLNGSNDDCIPGISQSFVEKEDWRKYIEPAIQWSVVVRSNLKNGDQKPIEKFIDWITPYVEADEGEFLGYMMEDITEVPTLIYYPNRFFKPDVPPEIAWD